MSEFRTGKGLKGQLLRGGVWSLAIKLLSTLMALLTAVVLARVLGPENYGIYAFIFALVSILAIPAQLGLPNLVVRETAKAHAAERWDVLKGLWRWATLVALGMSLLIMLVGGLAAMLFADQLGVQQTSTLWWGLLLVPLVALGNLRGAALRGLKKVVQGQLPEYVIRPALFILLLLVVTAWMSGDRLNASDAMALHALASATALLVGGWLLFASSPAALRGASPAARPFRTMIGSVLPFALISGMEIVSQSVGLVVLGLTSPPDEAGAFRVAMQMALVTSLGASVTKPMIAPYLARLHAEGATAQLQRLTATNATIAFLSALPAAVVLVVFGRPLIAMLFGTDFVAAYVPMIILVGGQLAGTYGASVGMLLNMTGHEKDTARITGVSLVVNIIATLFLALAWGGTGAAVASAGSLTLWHLLMAARARQVLGVLGTAFARETPRK